jgi:hypothetical protein
MVTRCQPKRLLVSRLRGNDEEGLNVIELLARLALGSATEEKIVATN